MEHTLVLRLQVLRRLPSLELACSYAVSLA